MLFAFRKVNFPLIMFVESFAFVGARVLYPYTLAAQSFRKVFVLRRRIVGFCGGFEYDNKRSTQNQMMYII